ncbi:hypothetical protein Daesc_010405 [Daldinia eschscholtzii]|uniref:Uncharacterized protein n=1 Tax=Daldinia eschscholtzii TaxID=292717 RepID=A0AAX6M7K8_9PEZI
MAGIRDSYKQAHDITDEDIKRFREEQLRSLNMMAWGASVRGGYTTTKDEAIAEMLKKEEQEAAREREKEKKWAEILNPSDGNSYVIEIIRDRCSAASFITARTVADYSLDTRQIKPTTFSDVAGGKFTCDTEAKVHWKGKDGMMRAEVFYVLPDGSPIEHALVGKDFDDAFGHFLLDSQPENLIAYTAQKPKTLSVEEQATKSSQDKIAYEQNKATKVGKSTSSKSKRSASRK